MPISITALTTQALEAKQVVDVASLNKVTPGFQVRPTFSPLEVALTLRGLTQTIPSINSDPPVGTYVDGIYNSINAGSNNALVDMERVEVLKGPQGTLFGRNTIGGTVSITTAKPTDKVGGYVEANLGNYDRFTGTAVLNVPLIPGKLSSRFVYQHSEHGGYGQNFTTGNPTSTFNQEYARGSLKFTPDDSWTVLATGFYTEAKGFGAPTQLGYVDTTAAIVPALGPTNTSIPALSGRPGDSLTNYLRRGGFQDGYGDIDSAFALKQYGATVSIENEISSAVTVKAIGGYIHTDYNTTVSLSGTPYVLVDVLDFPIDFDQYTGELQAYGKLFGGRLDWIAGLYYFNGRGTQYNTGLALPAISQAFGQRVTQNVSAPRVDNSSYSAYAQGTYALVDGLRLTAGIRYVVDERKVEYRDHSEVAGSLPGAFVSCSLANAPFATDPAACLYSAKKRYDFLPWTVGLDYKPNADLLLYAKVSKGYRSGAFTLAGPAAVSPSATVTAAQASAATAGNLAQFAPAAPEDLLSPEAGFKLEAFDRRFRLNGAAYYSWYNNVQVAVNGTAACTTCAPPSLLVNSGKAEIWGGELESSLTLGAFSLDGVAALVDARYVSGPLTGFPVSNVSKFNGSITGSYRLAARDTDLTLSTTYSYRSAAQLSPPSPARPAAWNDSLRQPGFGLWDARATLAVRDTPISFSLYALNLANTKYVVSTAQFAPPFGYTIRWPGAPRTYGGSVRLTF
ncbi:TonB-dependent receptor [Novosphingobium sp. BL-52-GroH]|uniref:TonB-dependent receptor n=1 Tax=Novosphingobium sp. BL-52-GroH TaxID=3349877 RepID=UPI00384C85EA